MSTLDGAGSELRKAFYQAEANSLQACVYDSMMADRKAGCGENGGKGGIGLFVRAGHYVKAGSIVASYPADLRYYSTENEKKIPDHLVPYIVYVTAENAKKLGRDGPLCVVPRSLSRRRGLLAFFANHSSSKRIQNAELQSKVVDGKLNIFIITIKDINARAGTRQEVIVNYRGKYANIINDIVSEQRVHATRVIVPRRNTSFFCKECRVNVPKSLTFIHRITAMHTK